MLKGCVEAGEERMLQGRVLHRLAEIVVHAPGGGEHALDTGRAVEAGAARYCLAILASLGKRYSWFFHQSSKTMSVSSSDIA